MPFGFARFMLMLVLVVLASQRLVHWPLEAIAVAAETPAKSQRTSRSGATDVPAPPASNAQSLSQPAVEIRDAILAAVISGDIEDLRTALDWNELKPEVADTPVADPIAYWRQLSADGQGREILGILGAILSQPFAVLPVGRDVENNRLYVWPRFAEVARSQLTPDEQAAMLRLVPPAVLDEMSRTGRYLSWRLVIGADGTWHSFTKAR